MEMTLENIVYLGWLGNIVAFVFAIIFIAVQGLFYDMEFLTDIPKPKKFTGGKRYILFIIPFFVVFRVLYSLWIISSDNTPERKGELLSKFTFFGER